MNFLSFHLYNSLVPRDPECVDNLYKSLQQLVKQGDLDGALEAAKREPIPEKRGEALSLIGEAEGVSKEQINRLLQYAQVGYTASQGDVCLNAIVQRALKCDCLRHAFLAAQLLQDVEIQAQRMSEIVAHRDADIDFLEEFFKFMDQTEKGAKKDHILSLSATAFLREGKCEEALKCAVMMGLLQNKKNILFTISTHPQVSLVDRQKAVELLGDVG